VSAALPAGLGCALVLAVAAVYAQTAAFGFVSFDDGGNVYENAHVRAGLGWAGASWAFTSFYAANWLPLTWLSYMLDVQLFGVDPGEMHVVNVLLHAGSSVLLFLAFARMTGALWRSAAVAGIFALHPLHVESVAWITERKDVLSTFFGALSLLCYARYAEAPSARRYVPVAAFFVLALLAKPMLVTLPLLFLLLDVWPLRRAEWPPSTKAAAQVFAPLLREKLPLLVLSAVASVLTVLAHRTTADNFATLEQLSLWERLGNALLSYVLYIGKALWPEDLAALYPLHTPATAPVAAAAAILGLLSAGAVFAARRAPYVLAGWLWYLGALAPVIGLVQNGPQAYADRFTYLPLTGLSVAAVWALGDWAGDRPFRRRLCGGLMAAALLFFAVHAHGQVRYWKDSETLYAHTLAIAPDNPVIMNNKGADLERAGRLEEAVRVYEANLRVFPGYARTRNNLAVVLGELGRAEESIVQSEEVLREQPQGDADAETNLCAAYLVLKRPAEAEKHCRTALRLRPGYLNARYALAVALAGEGRVPEALTEISGVLAEDPDYPDARSVRKRLRAAEGLPDE
jgi:tetratricopeptide (TPR) repeat protein